MIGPNSKVTLGSQILLPWPDAQTAVRVVRLGRADDNDFVTDASNVSSYHARILIGLHGTWLVEDLNSTNGIGIRTDDGIQPIQLAAMIGPSDTLMLGNHELPVQKIRPLFDTRARSGAASTPALREANAVASSSSKAQSSASVAAASPERLGEQDGAPASVIGSQLSRLLSVGAVLLIAALGTVFFLTRPSEATHDKGGASVTPDVVINDAEILSPNLKAGPPAASDLNPGNSLFWVLVKSADGKLCFRLGTASAVQRNRLITTGSVVRAIESLSKDGYPNAEVVHLKSGSVYRLSSRQTHPSLDSLISSATKFRQEYEAELAQLKPPSEDSTDTSKSADVDAQVAERKAALVEAGERMLRAEESLVDYDVGWLTVSFDLPDSIPILELTKSLTPRPKQALTLVAAPFDIDDPYFDPDTEREFVQEKFRVARVLPVANRDGERLQLEGDWELGESNLFGSPLLDSSGRLVGLFSRNQVLEPGKVSIDAVGPKMIATVITK